MTTTTRPGIAPTEPVRLALVGEDGNGFVIVARLRRALKDAGADSVYIQSVTDDATSGDYNHLLQVAMTEITEGVFENEDTEEEFSDEDEEDLTSGFFFFRK